MICGTNVVGSPAGVSVGLETDCYDFGERFSGYGATNWAQKTLNIGPKIVNICANIPGSQRLRI